MRPQIRLTTPTLTVPCDTTTGWTATHSTLSLNSTAGEYRSGLTSQCLKVTNTGDGASTFTALYALGAPVNLSQCHAVMSLRTLAGSGVTDPASYAFFSCRLKSGSASRSVACSSIKMFNTGAMALSAPVSHPYEADSGGTFDATAVDTVGVWAGFYEPFTNTPSFLIDGLWFCPWPAKATLCFQCDGEYASHYKLAAYLNRYGLRATFYAYEEGIGGSRLSIAALQEMQAMGHLIALYTVNWPGLTDEQRVATVIARGNWLRDNGFSLGARHMVIGGNGSQPYNWTWSLEQSLFPKHLDTYAWTAATAFQSHFTPRQQPRLMELNSTNLATIQSTLATTVSSRGRLGLLVHDITGGDWTAFDTLMQTNVLPAVSAGTLRVATVGESHG
jgi:hypothetical protein